MTSSLSLPRGLVELNRDLGHDWLMGRKTTLTPEEKLRAAAAKVMYGVPDAAIALILGISNVGRVNEAVKEVLAPLGLTAPGYKAAEPDD